MGARRRGIIVAGLCAAALPALGAPSNGLAATPGFQAPCATYGDQQICSGQVPSFDGTSLDVDVTLPAGGTGRTHPLIVMLHGYGNNKHEWESTSDEGDGADKYHWNSHWFSQRGFYVLTYTARGFHDPGAERADQPKTPGGSSARPESGPRASIHLKDRETEIRDTQWLAALVARAFPDLDRNAVAVTGGSYGGGESWVQAGQAQWTFPHERDSRLPVLQLQVAVPKYPWTDLAYSLAPNGHPGPWHAERDASGRYRPAGYCDVDPALEDDPCYSSAQASPDDPADVNPFGVVKSDYVNVFYGYAYTYGGTPPFMGPADQSTCDLPGSSVDVWYQRSMVVGEPYDGPGGSSDAAVAQQRHGLTECRSSYYQAEGFKAQANGPRRVAVFSIQGWTDDLFTAVESFRQFKYLKSLDPRWPVSVALADVGHPRAGNPPDAWKDLNARAWSWMREHIRGSHDQNTTVASLPTVCDAAAPAAGAGAVVEAPTPEALSSGNLVVRYARGGATTSKSPDPNGPASDPVADVAAGQIVPRPGNCPSSPGPAPYTAVSAALPDDETYVGLGSVTVPYQLTGAVAQLDARVWDVPPGPSARATGSPECEQKPVPDGCPLLLSRGTYRLDVPMGDTPAGELRIPLFGNHVVLPAGHRLRLDLTQLDGPYLRPSNLDSAIAFGPPTLTLPTRAGGTTTVSEETGAP